MLVRATKRGYYGVVVREPGQVFKLTDPKHFAEDGHKDLGGLGWMEKVESDPAPKKGQKGQAVGKRPPPPDEDEVAQRIAEADRMAEESAAQDKRVEADVI